MMLNNVPTSCVFSCSQVTANAVSGLWAFGSWVCIKDCFFLSFLVHPTPCQCVSVRLWSCIEVQRCCSYCLLLPLLLSNMCLGSCSPQSLVVSLYVNLLWGILSTCTHSLVVVHDLGISSSVDLCFNLPWWCWCISSSVDLLTNLCWWYWCVTSPTQKHTAVISKSH